MKRWTILTLILTIFLIAACARYQAPQQPAAPSSQPATQPSAQLPPNAVEITSSGFNPAELKVKVGDTVTWINKNTDTHWPASAMHPTHKVYPEAGGCIGSKFDACKGLAPGDSWSFTFNQVGSWGYHDHLNPGPPFFGKIIVK